MTPDQQKARGLRDSFDLSLDEYRKMLEAQDGKCAICSQPETHKRNGKLKALAVDHNHKTGAIRGLLCYFDNSQRLGRGNEDPEIHERLADYLRHGAERVAEIRSALDGG